MPKVTQLAHGWAGSPSPGQRGPMLALPGELAVWHPGSEADGERISREKATVASCGQGCQAKPVKREQPRGEPAAQGPTALGGTYSP